MSPEILYILIGALVSGILGAGSFFVARHFGSKDKAEEKIETNLSSTILKIDIKLESLQVETRTLTKEIANLDATLKAAWKSIDEMKADFREMRSRQDRFSEKLL